jgi:hypothetical protein
MEVIFARMTPNIYKAPDNRLRLQAFINEGWRKPSGLSYKSSNPNTFEGQFGFGFEEWQFNQIYTVNSYQYGYVEALNTMTYQPRQDDLLVLYTLVYNENGQGLAKRYPVACLTDWNRVENLTEEVGSEQLIIWRDTMKNDLQTLWPEPSLRQGLLDPALAQIDNHWRVSSKAIKNMRFRWEDVRWPVRLSPPNLNDTFLANCLFFDAYLGNLVGRIDHTCLILNRLFELNLKWNKELNTFSI